MNYPEQLPVNEIRFVVDAIRKNEVKTNAQEFGRSLWVVQGYAQRMIIGSPTPVKRDPIFGIFASYDGLPDLEKCLETADYSTRASLPWNLILYWLLQLLMELSKDS
jgi:hypothetical protein